MFADKQTPATAPAQPAPQFSIPGLPPPLTADDITRWLFAHPDLVRFVALGMDWMARRRTAYRPYPLGDTYVPPDILAFRPIDIGLMPKFAKAMVYERIFQATSRGFIIANEPATAEALWAYKGEMERVRKDAAIGPDVSLPAGADPGLFDGIVGYVEVKKAVTMLLNGRRPIPALFVGEPASGKTLFLEALASLPGAVYRSADGATAAGIRKFVIDDHPMVLVLDELDKVADVHALAPLNELLESQSVSVLKYGQNVREQTNTRVFAACNYMERIPKEIISKFHILRLKKYTIEEAYQVSTAYLKKLGCPPDISQVIAQGIAAKSRDIRDVRRAFDACRTVDEAKWWISQLGVEARV